MSSSSGELAKSEQQSSFRNLIPLWPRYYMVEETNDTSCLNYKLDRYNFEVRIRTLIRVLTLPWNPLTLNPCRQDLSQEYDLGEIFGETPKRPKVSKCHECWMVVV